MALSDLTLGRFHRADSPIHKLDARTKLAASVLLMGGCLYARSPWSFGLLYSLLLAAVLLSRVPPAYTLRNIRFFIWLISLAVLLNLFFTEGTQIASLGPAGITAEGICAAAIALVRLLFVVTTASLLTLTTAPLDMTDGLSRSLLFLRRFRVPVKELGLMSALALSYIPVLVDETRAVSLAQRSRGARLEGEGLRALKSSLALLLPVLVSSLRRADRLALAMESRCFRTAGERTSYSESRIRSRDWVALAVTIVAVVLSVAFAR
jgi:energy-coupling factor transport system permease protein